MEFLLLLVLVLVLLLVISSSAPVLRERERERERACVSWDLGERQKGRAVQGRGQGTKGKEGRPNKK